MGGDENGFAFFGENTDEVLELDAGLGVEAGGGLVHDEDLGVVEKGAPESEALGLAFGKLVRKAIGQGAEVGELHHFFDAAAAFVILETEGAGVEVEVFQDRHVVVVPEVIGHPADERTHFVGVVNDIDPTDFGRSHGGVVEGGENPHGGGFSGAIGSHEAADGAVGDFEGNAVDGFQLTEVTIEILDKDGRHLRIYR